MIEFRYSRHRALGDFKRTWRDGKTTCGATSAKCQGILALLGRGGMSNAKLAIRYFHRTYALYKFGMV
jgi:hypothetical protein